MKELFYKDLQQICSNIEASDKQKKAVIDAAFTVIKTADMARNEGILMLDMLTGEDDEYFDERDFSEFSEKWNLHRFDRNGFERYFVELLELVTDGVEPDYIEEYGCRTYCSSNFADVEKLIYMIYLDGALSIDKGIDSRFMKKMICALIPASMVPEFNEAFSTDDGRTADRVRKSQLEKIERLCNGNEAVDEHDHSVVGQCSLTIMSLSDAGIQRLLRETDNYSLLIAMKGMCGAVRKRIFDNMSQRLAGMAAENMYGMGPVRLEDVENECIKIMKKLINLYSSGEIACTSGIEEMKLVLDIHASAERMNNELKEKYKNIKEIIDKIYN